MSTKDMIAAVERALDDVAARPDTYPLHASLLADYVDRDDSELAEAWWISLAEAGELMGNMSNAVRQHFVQAPGP